MILLDEKMPHLPPPPPYVPANEPINPPPFPYEARPPPNLATLPPHLLLKIVYETFTSTASLGQRKTLYWLNTHLRLVSRAMYVACMHVLRSTYLPAYTELIRPPYTSDPFPLTSTSPSYSADAISDQPIASIQRETKVLDSFIALKVREDVWADDSELHLERDESFRDLFDLMQPRSRMEDLVRVYGVREGIITVPGSGVGCAVKKQPSTVSKPGPSSSSISKRGKLPPSLSRPQNLMPFASVSCSFSSRKAGLVLTTALRKRTIVDVDRKKDERLELGAKRLVAELKGWLETHDPSLIR